MNEIQIKRLFFALWPDDNTRQQCTNITTAIQNANTSPVTAANLHVTLVFLGQVTSDQEIILKQQAATIPVPEIILCFNQLSFWKKPKVLCLTATECSPESMMLVEPLSNLAKNLNIPIDEHPYQPHVTLIKKVKAPTTLDFEPITWHSNAFCLVESCSLPTGIEYRVIETWHAK
jgi:RNA 2',3'-cyclic 3'-phosphodiesterase